MLYRGATMLTPNRAEFRQVAGTGRVEYVDWPAEKKAITDAMLAISAEIARVAAGEWPLEQSPLRMAPHTADDLLGEWNRPYPRELGAYPLRSVRASKYFPPVSRIDSAYGDRNLMCSCEPLEAYANAERS